MPKYSIVTPVYNSFDLMSRYFDSLVNQTFKDFEVIIVDDCSFDDSYEKLVDFCKKTSLDITILKTEKNSGPGVARNLGMNAAKGCWLTFVDNDDWVTLNFLEKIDRALQQSKVDCLIFDFYIKKDDSQSVASSMYLGDEGFVPVANCISFVRNHSVGKVYNLQKCKAMNIDYPEVRRCEDVAFVARAIDACGSVYYLKEPLYFYYQRSSSLSNNVTLDETDMIQAFSIIERHLKLKYPNELKEKAVTDLLYGVVLMMCKSKKDCSVIKSYINDFSKKYQGWERCSIVNHVGLMKKIFLKFAQYRLIWGLKLLSFVHSKMIGA